MSEPTTKSNHNGPGEKKAEPANQPETSRTAEVINSFAGGIAHDFKNIFHIINGNVDDLIANTPPEDAKKLQDILAAAQKGTEVVNQLLAFSGKSEDNVETLDINTEITEFITIFESNTPETISIDLKLDEELEFIDCYPTQIDQIMQGICNKACDTMDSKGVITITTENCVIDDNEDTTEDIPSDISPGRYIKLTIAVTGPGKGTDEENIPKNVAEIINSLDGQICFESNLDQGTTYTLYLPASEKVEIFSSLVPENIESVYGNEIILVVDDEIAILRLTESMLSKFGYYALGAESGEEALEIYTEKRDDIDLVLLDLGMPGMGGHECLKKLIEFDPDVKVIISSGYSKRGLVKDTLKDGAKGYLIKPYLKNILASAIRNTLDAEK